MNMTLHIGRLSVPVRSYQHASEVYEAARDESGEGASTFPCGKITIGPNKVVAEVSYNGRVWAPNHALGDKPIYDNRTEQQA
jgi:hypothetical protein